MKFKIFTMLMTLGILSVTPMIYMGKFDPMAMLNSTFNIAKTETDSLKDKLPDTFTKAVSDKKVQVYKWRDENGVMQFSSTPPPDSRAEQILVDPNTNLMQAVKVEEKKEPEKKVVQVDSPNPYSVNKMKKVMDDAKGVEEMLQKRHEEQQKMLNDI
jgi:hypothetical protein